MPYRLEPQVAGELGIDTVLDTSTHPPKVKRLDFVLDQPENDELITSFPVFLISEGLGSRLKKAHLDGFKLAKAPSGPATTTESFTGRRRTGSIDGSRSSAPLGAPISGWTIRSPLRFGPREGGPRWWRSGRLPDRRIRHLASALEERLEVVDQMAGIG